MLWGRIEVTQGNIEYIGASSEKLGVSLAPNQSYQNRGQVREQALFHCPQRGRALRLSLSQWLLSTHNSLTLVFEML